MPRRVTLPIDLEVLAVPTLAILSVAEVSLAMMIASVHGEHLDLDELPRYFAEGGHPIGVNRIAERRRQGFPP